jgi:ketosteroid isomerase-like protein
VPESVSHATVESLYDAYERRDLARFADMLHKDIDWVIYAPVALFPFAGPRRGRTAVLEALTAIADSYALERYTREIVIVEDGRAAVIADVSYRQRATGRTMRFRVANFLRFADGKVIEFREFANTFDVVEQVLGRELQL